MSRRWESGTGVCSHRIYLASKLKSHPVLMNGTGMLRRTLDDVVPHFFCQLQSSLGLSALAPYTSKHHLLNHGNGAPAFMFIPIQLWFLSRLMIITGVVTLIVALCFLCVPELIGFILFWTADYFLICSFLFPDSPVNAWFLTPHERALAVLRIRENQTGVENKHFKKEQCVLDQIREYMPWLIRTFRMIEALLDPKTWMFALFSALDNVPNSLTNQQSIIIASYGFTDLQTTLLGCINGIVEIVTIYTGVNIAARFPNSRAYVGFIYFIPNVVGVVVINTLPWSDKVGLLVGQFMTGGSFVRSFALTDVWVCSLTGVGTTGFGMSLEASLKLACVRLRIS